MRKSFKPSVSVASEASRVARNVVYHPSEWICLANGIQTSGRTGPGGLDVESQTTQDPMMKSFQPFLQVNQRFQFVYGP
jgi:hypothetical protein